LYIFVIIVLDITSYKRIVDTRVRLDLSEAIRGDLVEGFDEAFVEDGLAERTELRGTHRGRVIKVRVKSVSTEI
jgi:hypothetical protein